MKTLLSWVMAAALVGGTVFVAAPRCESGSGELQRHMAGCEVCRRSPVRCPAAVALIRRQAPGARAGAAAEMRRWDRAREARD